jgi:hypothetical protein
VGALASGAQGFVAAAIAVAAPVTSRMCPPRRGPDRDGELAGIKLEDDGGRSGRKAGYTLGPASPFTRTERGASV